MSTDWTREPEIEDLVRKVRDEHHPSLLGYWIAVVGRPKAASHQGKVIVAKVQLASDLVQVVAEQPAEAVIVVGMDVWANRSPAEREAIIDHELYHLVSDEGELRVIGHDMEEFGAVIRRHGLWSTGLQLLGQMDLFKPKPARTVDDVVDRSLMALPMHRAVEEGRESKRRGQKTHVIRRPRATADPLDRSESVSAQPLEELRVTSIEAVTPAPGETVTLGEDLTLTWRPVPPEEQVLRPELRGLFEVEELMKADEG